MLVSQSAHEKTDRTAYRYRSLAFNALELQPIDELNDARHTLAVWLQGGGASPLAPISAMKIRLFVLNGFLLAHGTHIGIRKAHAAVKSSSVAAVM